MKTQLKKTNRRTLACTLGTGLLVGLSVGLGGCASTMRNSSAGAWNWTPPPRLEAGHAGSSGAVIASPVQADAQYYAYAPGQEPEFDRRDGSLNIQTYDSTAGFLGYPERQRPTLERSRTYYVGRTAERYTYPVIKEEYTSYRRTVKPSRPTYRGRRYHGHD